MFSGRDHGSDVEGATISPCYLKQLGTSASLKPIKIKLNLKNALEYVIS